MRLWMGCASECGATLDEVCDVKLTKDGSAGLGVTPAD